MRTDTDMDRLVDDFERGVISRRQLVSSLMAMGAAMAGAPAFALAAQETRPAPQSTFTALDLNHIALRVTDIGRSREFYRRHLGLTVASESRSSCFLRCRDQNFVALFRADEPAMDHYCYSIADYDAAQATTKLEAAGLRPRRQGNRVYFDDPDGLEVQVAAQSHNV